MKVVSYNLFSSLFDFIKKQKTMILIYGVLVLIQGGILFFTVGLILAVVITFLTILAIAFTILLIYFFLEYPDKKIFRNSLFICDKINHYFEKIDSNKDMERSKVEKNYKEFMKQYFPPLSVLITWKYYLTRDLVRYLIAIPIIAIVMRYGFSYFYEVFEAVIKIITKEKIMLSSIINKYLDLADIRISQNGANFFYYLYLLIAYYHNIQRINITIKQIDFMKDIY